MQKDAVHLYRQLIDEAFDCAKIPQFNYYASMTTAHAQRAIISLLKPRTLYKNGSVLIVKMFDRLCFIQPNIGIRERVLERYDESDGSESIDNIRVTLPFSPKHICSGEYKAGDLKRVESFDVLNHVMLGLVGI